MPIDVKHKITSDHGTIGAYKIYQNNDIEERNKRFQIKVTIRGYGDLRKE